MKTVAYLPARGGATLHKSPAPGRTSCRRQPWKPGVLLDPGEPRVAAACLEESPSRCSTCFPPTAAGQAQLRLADARAANSAPLGPAREEWLALCRRAFGEEAATLAQDLMRAQMDAAEAARKLQEAVSALALHVPGVRS